MKKKLLTLTAIAVVALFLLTPASALLSPISAVKENTMISEFLQVIKGPSIIPQSEFVITLDENEEVIWIADSVTRDDDIAYVTMEGDDSPQPIIGWYSLRYTVSARNWWGRTLFYTRAWALARFNILGRCTNIIDLSSGQSYYYRYTRFDFFSDPDGIDTREVDIFAQGCFIDNLVHRSPEIRVWISHEFDQNGITIWMANLDWGD